MEFKINEELRIESDISFYMVNNFRFNWKPNCHALLQIWGGINYSQVKVESLYNSKIKIWREKEDKNEILFIGCIVKATQDSKGMTEWMYIEALSSTFMLDWKLCQKSFQMTEKTYADVVQETVADASGCINCIEGNTPIGKPLIQYRETAWAFSKRLASYLENCIVADITSESPALWFGMRNGSDIPSFSENEYSIQIKRMPTSETETVYEVKSREFFMLGDKTIFMSQKMIICDMTAFFENGELIFVYSLKNKIKTKVEYHELFNGLGLKGTITEIQGEQAKVALDIDGESSTGYYFYDWNSETGNVLYAMPEIGTKVVLNLATRNEQDGFLVHCMPKNTNESNYHNRYVKTLEGNDVNLLEQDISFIKGDQHRLVFDEGTVTALSFNEFNVSAKSNVKIDAMHIGIVTPDELSICQG